MFQVCKLQIDQIDITIADTGGLVVQALFDRVDIRLKVGEHAHQVSHDILTETIGGLIQSLLFIDTCSIHFSYQTTQLSTQFYFWRLCGI